MEANPWGPLLPRPLRELVGSQLAADSLSITSAAMPISPGAGVTETASVTPTCFLPCSLASAFARALSFSLRLAFALSALLLACLLAPSELDSPVSPSLGLACPSDSRREPLVPQVLLH